MLEACDSLLFRDQEWNFWLYFFSTAQRGPSRDEDFLPRICLRIADPDFPGRDAYLGCDFQQPQADRLHLVLRPFRSCQTQPPQPLDQHIGQGREVQAKLIRPQELRAHAVTEQAELFFDAVLHLSPCAVELFVELLGRPSRGWQRRDHVARILLARDLFGLGDDATSPAPGLARLVEELG